MKTKEKDNINVLKPVKNQCVVCGESVKWGVNGCPIANKGQEMLALLGGAKDFIHYDCVSKYGNN